MSETYQLVSGADPEMSLYEGIAFYETGEVHRALSCWRDLLQRVPDHEIAQHYIKFVQGYLGLSADASAREVSTAQLREAKRLRGEPEIESPHQDTSYYSDESTTKNEPSADPPETLNAPTRSQVTSRSLSKTAIGGIEPQSLPVGDESVSAVTPSAVAQRSAAEAISPRSSVARHAVEGPSGPRTQADGLTIQSLSRQLASLHRSGKYEEAVEIAKLLLIQDPQHQVARRYIDEYHRQKQVAIQQRKKPQSAQAEGSGEATQSPVEPASSTRAPVQASNVSAPTSAPTSIPSPLSAPSAHQRDSIGGETYLGSPSPVQSVSAVEFDTDLPESESELSSEAPTRAPVQVPAPVERISDLEARPQVKMRPDQISWQEFDHRAGFFTSQVDGETSYEELIMISGMPREQALKILNELVASGVIG